MKLLLLLSALISVAWSLGQRPSVVPNDKSLFFCNFADATVCNMQVWHENNAMINPDQAGGFNYLSFTLNPGQKVMFALPQPVTPSGEDGVCARIDQRRGASDESGQNANQLKAMHTVGDDDKIWEYKLQGESKDWKATGANWYISNGSSWNTDPLTIWFTFEAFANATAPQFLDVKEIHIFNGECYA